MTANTDQALAAVVAYGDARAADQKALDATKITVLQAALDAANAELATYKQPVTPVVSTKTKFGACAANGASADSVVAKYGTGAAVRIFQGAIGKPTIPAGASVAHVSYSLGAGQTTREQILKDLAAGKNDAAITAAAKAAVPTGVTLVLEIVHEADLKVTNGSCTYETAVAAKSHFYDVVKAANPKVLVANTVTGWLADPKSGNDLGRWGKVKADVLGIDCDGAQAKTLPYTNYDDEIRAAKAFIKSYAANGYKYVAAPEWGTANLSTDINGVERVKWIAEYGAKFQGFLYVCWYDFHMVNDDRLLLTNEVNALKSLVSGGK